MHNWTVQLRNLILWAYTVNGLTVKYIINVSLNQETGLSMQSGWWSHYKFNIQLIFFFFLCELSYIFSDSKFVLEN